MNAKDLNGLEVLLAVVRSGSFSGAARDLGMSQPGVSRAIERLETRFGTRFFDRTTRQIVLTAEGRAFYGRVSPLLDAVEDALSQTQEQRDAVRGRLRVSVDTVFPFLVPATALKSFLTRYPDLQLELIRRDASSELRADLVDMDIRFGQVTKGSFVLRKLGQTRVLTVAAPRYLQQLGHPATPRELAGSDHTLIDFHDPTSARPYEWIFRRRREEIALPTRGRLVLNDIGLMHRMCVAGFGIAQVLEVAVREHLASGRLVPLFPEWQEETFPVHALYTSREHLPQRIGAFLEFVTVQSRKSLSS